MSVDETAIIRHLTDLFPGVETVTADGNTFFFTGSDHMFPWATLVTSDDGYDNFSDLNRPAVFRLNIGVGKETFTALFGSRPPRSGEGDEYVPAPGYDYTVLDTLLPYPVYGRQYWLCVLNPSEATFAQIQPLFVTAHTIAADRDATHAPRD